MKVFAVFALLAVAVSARDLCDNSDADLSAAEEYRDLIRGGALTIFGHCATFDIDSLLFSGSCAALFDQAFCYGQIAAVKYADVDTVSYEHLKGDVGKIQHLGELSCDHARNCIDTFSAAFGACKAADPNFVNGVISRVEGLYEQKVEAQVKAYAKENPDTIVGELISLITNRFQSVADIEAAINEYVSDDIRSDAKAAGAAIQAAAAQWCDDNCGEATGRFLKKLFGHMHGGGCVDASAFCGDCQNRANSFFVGRNSIPCCLDDVIQQSIKGVAYVRDTYESMISDFKEYLSGELSAKAVSYAEGIRDRVVAELACLDQVYESNKPSCA